MAFNGLPMARTYLVFGDIDGKLDMLRVECTRCGRKPLQRPQANREIRAQGQHDEMEAAAQWRLPQAGRAPIAGAPRPALPRSAEGDLGRAQVANHELQAPENAGWDREQCGHANEEQQHKHRHRNTLPLSPRLDGRSAKKVQVSRFTYRGTHAAQPFWVTGKLKSGTPEVSTFS
jgi:hypothetical protein